MKSRKYRKRPAIIVEKQRDIFQDIADLIEENNKPISITGYVLSIVLVILTLFLLASCKSPQPVTQVPIVEREKIVERLVPVPMRADSTSFFALLECDSMNNVVLKQLKEQKSKGIESDFSFSDGRFDYKAKTNPDTVYIPVTDTIRIKDVPVEVVRAVKVNELTMWQKIRIWWANISMGALGLTAILMFFKWKL